MDQDTALIHIRTVSYMYSLVSLYVLDQPGLLTIALICNKGELYFYPPTLVTFVNSQLHGIQLTRLHCNPMR